MTQYLHRHTFFCLLGVVICQVKRDACRGNTGREIDHVGPGNREAIADSLTRNIEMIIDLGSHIRPGARQGFVDRAHLRLRRILAQGIEIFLYFLHAFRFNGQRCHCLATPLLEIPEILLSSRT